MSTSDISSDARAALVTQKLLVAVGVLLMSNTASMEVAEAALLAFTQGCATGYDSLVEKGSPRHHSVPVPAVLHNGIVLMYRRTITNVFSYIVSTNHKSRLRVPTFTQGARHRQNAAPSAQGPPDNFHFLVMGDDGACLYNSKKRSRGFLLENVSYEKMEFIRGRPTLPRRDS